VHFRCLGCQQSLVADESGAGVSFQCPHCNSLQAIPHTPTPLVSLQTLAEDEKPASARLPQPPSDGGLWVAQERLWQNEHQSAEQAVALVERDQRISALRAECDWLSAQLDEERQRCRAMEPELDVARSEWAAAEKRANELETGFHHSSTRLQQAEMAVEELTRQLEQVKTERSEAVLNLSQQHETLAELNLELNKARADRAEMEQILGRARTDLERATADRAGAESLAEQSSAEAIQLKAALAQIRAELGLVVVERNKLEALVKEDLDLSDYLQVREARDRFEMELRETQTRQDGYREKIENLLAEREILKRERTDLQLKVAALRDAHDNTQLEQDNEILRRMVERLNEELKEAQPQSARHKRKAATGCMVGNIARAVAARCLVPDPDVAEGQ